MEVTLYQGDCLEILESLPGNCADLIILDPPYLTTKESWDQEEVVRPSLSEHLFRIGKPHSSLYVWCGIGEKSQSLIRWFPIFNALWHFKDLITWKKQRGVGMRKGWLYTREEIMWFVKDNRHFIWDRNEQYGEEKRTFTASYADKDRMEKYLRSVKSPFKRITNVWTDIRETNISWNRKEVETLHFTPKPVAAIERIIRAHTKEGDTVLDCFLGAGTTGVACVNTSRNLIGIELGERYFEFSRRRIERAQKEIFERLFL